MRAVLPDELRQQFEEDLAKVVLLKRVGEPNEASAVALFYYLMKQAMLQKLFYSRWWLTNAVTYKELTYHYSNLGDTLELCYIN